VQGPYTGWSTRCRNKSKLARPYIWRLTSFSRVIEVEVIQPDQGVLAVLQQMGGNPADPKLRAPVAQAAKTQGLSLSKKLASFWDDSRPD
jgi:hypothetical protein